VKESKWTGGTHFLKSIEEGTTQESKKKWACKRHSHSGKCKERGRQVRRAQEGEQARGTHFLESADG
jgi:hypothetical protein